MRSTNIRTVFLIRTLFLPVMMSSTAAVAQVPSLTLIPPPPGRLFTSATSISADGQFVAGFTTLPGSNRVGFSWTRAGGLVEWGSMPGIPSPTIPVGISNDGQSIAGYRPFPSGIGMIQAADSFRFTNGTYQVLGTPPEFIDQVYAQGMSGDGSTIAGWLGSAAGIRGQSAYRWTAATGIQDMGKARPTDFGAGFTGISRDGSTMLGVSGGGFGGADAFTWTQARGWRLLPVPADIGSEYDARPFRSNTDGSIVVGYVQPIPNGNGERFVATAWRNGVPQDLGTFGDIWDMQASAVSDDGSIISGAGRNSSSPGTTVAAIWINGSGPINFQDYLASLGVSVPGGWRIEGIGAMSADGHTILGSVVNGTQHQSFVAVIPSPGGVGVMGIVASACLTRRRRRPNESLAK